MTEIEPTIQNVQPGDTVTIERGAPGEPGHASLTYLIASSSDKAVWSHEVTVSRVQKLTESGMGYGITRITRPAPPIPTTPGERFWAIVPFMGAPREFIVTDERCVVDLTVGNQWGRQWFEERFTVVPAPKPETVPVPADLIREAERWDALPIESSDVGVGILTRIVQAVREREGADDE